MSHKILVIEDDPDTRTALAIRLKAAGFVTAFAADGVEAVSAAARERPDLVLLDLGLPAGDGFSVLERLGTLGATSSTPVIVCSAREAATNRDRALRAGAVAYLQKPLKNEALLATIRTHLPPSAAMGSSASARVLIIEDDEDSRRGLAMRLGKSGFEAVTAADAVTGFAAAVKEVPDALVLDLGLPGGDGLGVITRVRNHPRLSQVPVIVLSARPAATERDRALRAGAFAYFEKPADNRELLGTLRRAIGRNPGDD